MGQQHPITFGQTPRIALWVGIVLTLIGLVVRYLLGIRGINALTPALLGLPIALMGFVALEPQYTRGALLGVIVMSLLGILIMVNVLPSLNALLLGRQPSGSAIPIIAESATLLLCGVLLIVCVGAFAGAWFRRSRR